MIYKLPRASHTLVSFNGSIYCRALWNFVLRNLVLSRHVEIISVLLLSIDDGSAVVITISSLSQTPLGVILRLQVKHIPPVAFLHSSARSECTWLLKARFEIALRDWQSPGIQCTRVGNSLQVGIAVCSCSYTCEFWGRSLESVPWCCGCLWWLSCLACSCNSL